MSLAIAYQMKKKAKMAQGGMACAMCEGGSCPKHMYANGGDIMGVHEAAYSTTPGQSTRGNAVRAAKDGRRQGFTESPLEHEQRAKKRSEKNLQDIRSMKKPELYAEGGEVEDHDEDIVSRIMKARMMSKGGMVANEDHGKDEDELAGFEKNEFDDLALNDDLESSYTGKDSGDEIGDHQEDEDRHDLVSRIMRARKMKDRMPKPGVGHYGT